MPPLSERHMSAAALDIYLKCPLRFRYRYVDNLYWSKLWGSAPDERKALERGQNFHLMARRYYLGLQPAVTADPVEQQELDQWMELLSGFLPFDSNATFHPELELRLNRPTLKMVAKFDLVVVAPDGRATIYDWKTERRMPRRTYLQNAAQTLVYRYMLCEAAGAYSPRGQFRPEEIAMVYWNPHYPEQWERLTYTRAQYEKDSERLAALISQIVDTPRDYFLATTEEKVCRGCEYQMICHGKRTEQVDLEDEEWQSAESVSWDFLSDLS